MEDPRIISALFIFLKMAYYNVLINTVIQCPLQGRNTQSTNRRFVRGVYFALKRWGLGEQLFYFADIVFIEQVSSLIDTHKSL